MLHLILWGEIMMALQQPGLLSDFFFFFFEHNRTPSGKKAVTGVQVITTGSLV